MKYLVVILVFVAFVLSAFGQTAKPKKSGSDKPAKASSVKTPAAKSAAAATRSASKTKSGTAKPATRSTSAAKTGKPVSAGSKPAASANTVRHKPTSKAATTAKTPKVSAVKVKRSEATPIQIVDDKAEYLAAIAIVDLAGRIDALRKFLAAHPRSEHAGQALDLLVRTEAESAGSSLRAGDMQTAVRTFTAAARDTPKPVPDQLFAEVVSKFPAALFWRGEQTAALEIAAILEEKCSANAGQMLTIAGFYLSLENGAEAKRIANRVIAQDPASSPAYMVKGLADRIDFRLDDAATAYAKALELDPQSAAARRGLAEMKRAQAKPDEAAELYRQILAVEGSNVPAQTGLILSLFDADKRTEAESAMTAALEANPGNVMLLAGAAYWYAAHQEGQRAVELAQKAIAADPRFIWSHIALARGYLVQKRPNDAEKTLLAARRYGNFPTLEYEIASARAMAGFYREAAEELAKSFVVTNGVISTKLGGRISRESTDFTELVALERRASISAPTAADTPENSALLRSLLDLWIKLGAKEPDAEALSKAADDFARGDDNMRVHRQLFAAKELLERKKALPKVLELAKAAIGNDDTSLDVPSPSAAVMADELYDSRKLAATRNEYINVPDVPRSTLLNIIRGRIEDLNGRALFETDNKAEAVVRLKRAASILPAGSSWWRTSVWRLGSALDAEGKGSEALDAYIRSYKGGQPDVIRYAVIASLYTRLNGNLAGLEARIGPNPAAGQVAKNAEPARDVSVPVTSAGEVPAIRTAPETPAVKPDATPQTTPGKTPEPNPEAPKTEPGVTPTPEITPTPEPKPEPSPIKTEPTPQPSARPETNVAEAKAEPTPTPADVISVPKRSPDENLVARSTEPAVKTADEIAPETRTPPEAKPAAADGSPLFPPVVISIAGPESTAKKTDPEPKPERPSASDEKQEPAAAPVGEPRSSDPKTDPQLLTGDARPRLVDDKPKEMPSTCSLTLSETSLTLQNNGGDLAIIAGTEDDRDITEIRAVSSDPKDVEARREPIEGIKGRALFVVRSISPRVGTYQITFILPCGQKELLVKVR